MSKFNTTLTMEQVAAGAALMAIGSGFKNNGLEKHIEGDGRNEALQAFGAYCAASEEDKLHVAEDMLDGVEALLEKCEEYKKIIIQATEEGEDV